MFTSDSFIVAKKFKTMQIWEWINNCDTVIQETLLSSKREHTTYTCNNMDESEKHDDDWKKPETDFFHMKFKYR